MLSCGHSTFEEFYKRRGVYVGPGYDLRHASSCYRRLSLLLAFAPATVGEQYKDVGGSQDQARTCIAWAIASCIRNPGLLVRCAGRGGSCAIIPGTFCPVYDGTTRCRCMSVG